MHITPKKISLEICTLCNLTCEMCFLAGFKRKNIAGAKEPNAFFPFDLFRKLIDEISEKFPVFSNPGSFSFIFTGGESFLHPKIFDFLSYAKRKNIGITVFTNGTLIDSRLTEQIVEASPEALMFSLDGPQDIHDAIRGKGNFEKTYNAIKMIQEEKRKTGVIHPKIFINTLIHNLNTGRLKEMITIGDELKIGGISFSHIQWSTSELSKIARKEFKERLDWSTPESRIIEAMEHDLLVTKDKIISLLAEIDSIKKNHQKNHSFYIHFFPDLLREEIVLWYSSGAHKIDFCAAPENWLRIDVHGNVQPICALVPFSFGNLKEHSLYKIIDSENAQKFFNELEINGFFYACGRCCRRSHNSRSIAV